MRIDRGAVPFVAGALAPAAVAMALGGPAWALPFVALGGFLAFFFRDPHREIPADPSAVVAPADGRIIVAGEADAGLAPPGSWLQVSTFLSPLDVHINRAPIGGRVTRVDYRVGRRVAAYKPEAGSVNERSEIWIERQGEHVVCRQVAGVLARRVVCRVRRGAEIRRGERVGLIRFGSRFDVFLPRRAVLAVAPGERVRAGETIIARL